VKAMIGHGGKVITYGLDGEKAHNYVKYGLYVSDADARLKTRTRRWLQSWVAIFW
jgi:hypothetical protein